MSFLIYTLGCKVNTYESEMMKEKLLKAGYFYDETNPQIIIINTCSVTNVADSKSRKMIRHFKNKFPQAILVVCGCSAQNKPTEYQNLGIDILIGNQKKSEITSLIENYLCQKQNYTYINSDRKLAFEDMQIAKFTTHTRAYVKIEDGCDNFCSYCVIPYVRGSIRSKDFNIVLKEVHTLVSNGHQEIVLTGIHTGAYLDKDNHDLTDLIHEISKEPNLKRIRLSSIEITELNTKFLKELQENPKICNHLHIPLQAGSDEILKIMHRKYDLQYYQDKIKAIRKIRPNIAITTDIIIGHPYETAKLFNKTLETVKKLAFAKVHVFPYSKRDKTLSASMPNQVDEQTKKEWCQKLIALSNTLENEYYQKFIGQAVEVLIEKSNNTSIGLTDNYLKVKIFNEIKRNTLVNVKITAYQNGFLIGTVIVKNHN